MYRVIPFLRRLLRMLYQYCYVLIILCLSYGLFRQPLPKIQYFLFLLAALAVSYVFRDICSRGIILLIPHIVVGGIAFLIGPDIYLKVIMALCIFEYFIDAFIYMNRGYTLRRLFDTPWLIFFLGIAVAGLGTYLKMTQLTMIGYLIPVICIFIYLISLYLEGLEDYLSKTRNVSGAPVKQIVSINSIIVTGVIFTIIVVLVLGYVLHFDVALMAFIKALMKLVKLGFIITIVVLGFIFSILNYGRLPFGGKLTQLEDVEDKSSLLMDIIYFLMITTFLVAIVYLIVRLILWIIKLMLAKQGRDFELAEDFGKKEKLKVEREVYRRTDSLTGNSPRIKARRIYRNKVLSFRNVFKPDKTHTTGDINKVLGKAEESCSTDMEQLTSIYDEVRYGDLIPDDDILRKMKKLR